MLATRLTARLGIRHPIISAPMALAAGGRLAATVTRAGGFGLIGGGYGDTGWIQEQFAAADGERVGLGFITWSVQRHPGVVTDGIACGPAAVMLSFGDPGAFAEQVKQSGALLICQCQTLDHVAQSVAAGADIVVAQGSEAGGHGALRGTLSLVPEVADYLAANAPETLLAAGGGIADGRALAAALMLGADGVLMGTRLWASTEALVHPNHHDAILHTAGDGTVRTKTPDIARRLDWPSGFTARIKQNVFTQRWHGNEAELAAQVDVEGPRYHAAFAAGDADNSAVFFGEAAGIIDSIEPVATIIERVVAGVKDALRTGTRLLGDAAG